MAARGIVPFKVVFAVLLVFVLLTGSTNVVAVFVSSSHKCIRDATILLQAGHDRAGEFLSRLRYKSYAHL